MRSLVDHTLYVTYTKKQIEKILTLAVLAFDIVIIRKKKGFNKKWKPA